MSAQVTSFKDLQVYAKGAVVEFPPFSQGQPFVARIKRPSMITLMSKGKIPNSLRVKVNELFIGGGSYMDADDEDLMKDLSEILAIFAEASFIEPSYNQIKESGIELTDEQMMFLFNYVQAGIKQLEPFREEPSDNISNIDGEDEQ
jgi:hypothetical protein